MANEKNISIIDIIWPYRPDILIRINFLDWFYQNREKYLFDNKSIKNENDIISNKQFFDELKKHPYFFQYTRKHRYRKLNLNKSESEKVYANGILKFIVLMEDIKRDGFDINSKIGLYKSLLIKSPDYGPKINRKFYMGDGCHRLACLIWIEKNIVLPKEFFKVQSKLVYKPVNSFGIFKKLKIIDSNDEIKFYQLFNSTEKPNYNEIIGWSEGVRNRFWHQNIDELFNIKFTR